MLPLPPGKRGDPRTVVAQPVARGARPWLRWILAFMGSCTPGGFLFLLALAAETNIHFDTPVWFILAGVGGFAGYRLGRHLDR